MSTWYFVAPYSPAAWEDPTDKGEKPTSDLRIDPAEYQRKLSERWNEVSFRTQSISECLLEWSLPQEHSGIAGLWGCLQSNQQIVEFGTGPKRSFLDFILWHRSLVPMKYQLFLFNSSSWESLELVSETTADDIVVFTGIVG